MSDNCSRGGGRCWPPKCFDFVVVAEEILHSLDVCVSGRDLWVSVAAFQW